MSSYLAHLRRFFSTYREPLITFLASRIILFLAFFFLEAYRLGTPSWVHWDAHHYLSIAEAGYTFDGTGARNNTIAFFPLYPLLIKLGLYLGLPALWSALLLSFVFGIAGALVLFRYAQDWKDQQTASAAVWLYAFYPFSIFLSLPYTESLFFFLALSALYAMRKQKLLLAACAIALASITRMTGLALVPLFLWHGWQNRTPIRTILGYVVISLVPFAGFLAFQSISFDTPLAFLQAQAHGWGKSLDWPWSGLALYLRNFDRHFFWRIDLLILLFMITTLFLASQKVDRSLLWFGWLLILMTISSNWILGTSRYMLMMLPFYFFWGETLANKPFTRSLVYAGLAAWATLTAIGYWLHAVVL